MDSMRILDFYADWCQPCKMMEPTIEDLKKEFVVEQIDIEADPDRAMAYGVMSIPTLIVELDGKELKRFTGITSTNTIKQDLGL